MYARCTVCVSDFLILHGGEFVIKKHVKTLKHQQNFKFQEDSSKWKLEKFFVKTDSKMEHAITNAECLFTSVIIEHNLSIALSDHATKIFPKMFPDSEIREKAKKQCFNCCYSS